MGPIYKVGGVQLNGWLSDEINDRVSRSLKPARDRRRMAVERARKDELYAVIVGIAVGIAATALCALYGYIGHIGLS